jgi:hypothetical protein
MSYSFVGPADDDSRSGESRAVRLAKAQRLFATFAGFAAPCVAKRRIERTLPEVLVDLGALRGVVYTKDHGGGTKRTYIHFMDDPPRLLCDEGGRQLYVLGGNYRVTRRGIEG